MRTSAQPPPIPGANRPGVPSYVGGTPRPPRPPQPASQRHGVTRQVPTHHADVDVPEVVHVPPVPVPPQLVTAL
eukprot:5324047-Amphidinium_carterae.1